MKLTVFIANSSKILTKFYNIDPKDDQKTDYYFCPENGLHPKEVCKWLEKTIIQCKKIKKNLTIYTFSPYILSHLSNITHDGVKWESPEIMRKQAKYLFLKNPQAFLKIKQLKAFEICKKNLKNLKDSEFGINWVNLGDVFNELQSTYLNIYSLKDLKDPDYSIRWDTLSDVSSEVQSKYFELYKT